MKFYLTQNFIPLFVLLLTFGKNSVAQNLLESEPYSRHAYVYKLSTAQAKTFFEAEKPIYNPDYFKTLIDSFSANGEYQKPLDQGYYLKVKIVEKC